MKPRQRGVGLRRVAELPSGHARQAKREFGDSRLDWPLVQAGLERLLRGVRNTSLTLCCAEIFIRTCAVGRAT